MRKGIAFDFITYTDVFSDCEKQYYLFADVCNHKLYQVKEERYFDPDTQETTYVETYSTELGLLAGALVFADQTDGIDSTTSIF